VATQAHPLPASTVPTVSAKAADSRPALAGESPARVTSVDALRGFDMFWIIGAASLVRALEGMSNHPVTHFLATQLQHVEWEGFRFYDLIFPLFLFLIGVSLDFSLHKAIPRDGKAPTIKRILRRSLLLFVLGVFYSGGLLQKWPEIALAGVLQRIAACYLFAALIYCTVQWRARLLICVSLLVGYWALVTFVPFPDLRLEKKSIQQLAARIGSDSPAALAAATPEHVSGLYEEGRNLTNYFDFRFLPGKKAQTYYVNEGLLSTLPAISICLFGAMAGWLLRNDQIEPRRKVAWLLAAGAAGVLLGFLWSLQFPLIKRIWTSSFVLVATGYSAMLLGMFYLVVDVWKFRKWCQPLVWIGMNSITIYLAVNIVGFQKLAERFVGGDVKSFLDMHVAQGLGGMVVALVGLGLAILLARFLYQRNIFLRL
jgi:predicted acyltransferase